MIDLNNIGLPVNGEYVVEVTDHAFLEAENLVQETKLAVLRKAQDLAIKTGGNVDLRVKFTGTDNFITGKAGIGGYSNVSSSNDERFSLAARITYTAFELKALEVFGA